MISINFDYKSKRTKFKIPLISQKEVNHVCSIISSRLIESFSQLGCRIITKSG
jgi:hypothetical protein